MTKLHPHQKSGLAWMMKHEQKENQGMNGGILADVSKTISALVICLLYVVCGGGGGGGGSS